MREKCVEAARIDAATLQLRQQAPDKSVAGSGGVDRAQREGRQLSAMTAGSMAPGLMIRAGDLNAIISAKIWKNT